MAGPVVFLQALDVEDGIAGAGFGVPDSAAVELESITHLDGGHALESVGFRIGGLQRKFVRASGDAAAQGVTAVYDANRHRDSGNGGDAESDCDFVAGEVEAVGTCWRR